MADNQPASPSYGNSGGGTVTIKESNWPTATPAPMPSPAPATPAT